MAVVIEAQNLSKRFFLGERNRRTFFEDVAYRSKRAIRQLLQPEANEVQGASRRELWALRDVSFQISQGQTLAIIGENGAGKSTLLKVLSRITQPTTGRVKVYGRLASLLEVGTGFHPEFSGRDNIYLNGAMLGLSRKEVEDRFDRIVEFSGLERFLDVPVKNYSSGMYVRMAFSVAAHLNPEIVILDEVLAVGDAVFQKKCFDRMEEIIDEGHAAILVSHGMGAVRKMSQVCLWLRHGRIEMFGPTHEVVSAYEKQTTHEVMSLYEHKSEDADPAQPEPPARLLGWTIEPGSGPDKHLISPSQHPFSFRFEIELLETIVDGRVAVSISDIQGLVLFTHQEELVAAAAGKIGVTLHLPTLPLKPGEYILSCTIFRSGHPVAFLRATPELTIHSELNESYSGLLNLPAHISVEQNLAPEPTEIELVARVPGV